MSHYRYDVVSDELLSKSSIVLVCEGLDTVGKVYVNGILIGESENMFVRYIYNIKNALQVYELNNSLIHSPKPKRN